MAIFWHIPWPNPEAFGICPWQAELLDGLLGADLIGFHIPLHCNNFLATVDRVLESRTDREHMTVAPSWAHQHRAPLPGERGVRRRRQPATEPRAKTGRERDAARKQLVERLRRAR